MTSTTINLKGKIAFVSAQSPGVEDGTYQVGVSHTLKLNTKNGPDAPFAASTSFVVEGPRVALSPSQVVGVFPSENSRGNYGNILPHVILKSSTLPWQRSIETNAPDGTPWLALVVLDETTETKSPPYKTSVQTVEELEKPTNPPDCCWPGLNMTPGIDEKDQVTVVDIQKGVITDILPPTSDLDYLAHVRQSISDAGDVEGSNAVVVANRLPQPKGRSVVHLISLENRYSNGNLEIPNSASDTNYIRFISLKSWKFSSFEEFDFAQVLSKVNVDMLKLTTETASSTANILLESGKIPLSHEFRTGDKFVSWYSGPLVPVQKELNPSPAPPKSADDLLQFYEDPGMFDVSYAAAWELGRLLMLQNKGVSENYFLWRLECAKALNQAESRSAVPHLHNDTVEDTIAPFLPEEVVDFWTDLQLLKHIPFQYLVPDEKALPTESIRFFQMDQNWIQNLLIGSASIGGAYSTKLKSYIPDLSHGQITGFLLRSEVVSGYPEMQALALDTNGTALEQLRLAQLSPNVLIGLFAGDLATLNLHQKPEALHFAVDIEWDRTKLLKSSDGGQLNKWVDLIWAKKKERVLSPAALAKKIDTKVKGDGANPAQFAMEMITGAEEVLFSVGSKD